MASLTFPSLSPSSLLGRLKPTLLILKFCSLIPSTRCEMPGNLLCDFSAPSSHHHFPPHCRISQVMDAALLLVAGNETCPQPQTSEHLAAVEIMRLQNIIILQNKVGMVGFGRA